MGDKDKPGIDPARQLPKPVILPTRPKDFPNWKNDPPKKDPPPKKKDK